MKNSNFIYGIPINKMSQIPQIPQIPQNRIVSVLNMNKLNNPKESFPDMFGIDSTFNEDEDPDYSIVDEIAYEQEEMILDFIYDNTINTINNNKYKINPLFLHGLLPEELVREIEDFRHVRNIDLYHTNNNKKYDINFNATLLHHAILNKNNNLVKLLIDNGANIELKDTYKNMTALEYAIINKNVEGAKIIMGCF